MAATAEAVQTFIPTVAFVDTLANWKTATGNTLSSNAKCNTCILNGGEYVMTAKADFVAKVVSAQYNGNCCTPGKYKAAESICDITPDDTMKKSSAWKQPEMALANCPNPDVICDSKTPRIDLDKESGAITRVTGQEGYLIPQSDNCSYIATSKCKAPTVNVKSFVNKETKQDLTTANSLWEIYYFEYTAFETETTDLTVEVSNKEAMETSVDKLGGEMWPVQWYNAADVKTFVPAETFAKWISVSNTAYAAYTPKVDNPTYKADVDTWNYFAAQVQWMKQWLKDNTGKTELTEEQKKVYTDKLVERTDAAGAKVKFSPEKPMVPPLPASYDGPTLLDKGTLTKNQFQLVGGYGKPTLGKLALGDPLGTQHMYGVKGTGNLATNDDADIQKLPNAVSLLYPAQPDKETDDVKCKTSTLVVIVRGSEKQKTKGNTVTLEFKIEEFGKNPLVLSTKPTATTVVPLAREAANYLAAGFATASLVAASLY